MGVTEDVPKQTEGEVIMDHLIEAYGIQPFMSEAGQLGIHFNELSASSLSEFTVLDETESIINGWRKGGDGPCGWEGRDELQVMQRSLRDALAKIDAALAKIEPGPWG